MRTLAVILAGLTIVMLTAGISWKIVILSIVAAFLLLFLLRRFIREHDGLFWIATVEPPDLQRKKCLECDGCGALWLNPHKRQWVIIPHHLRRVNDSTPYIRAPLVNVRACNCCRGRGFHLIPRFGILPRDPRPKAEELAKLAPPVPQVLGPEESLPWDDEATWSPDLYDPSS